MSVLLEAEATRIGAQRRLDALKTAKERNQWGQFATPPALSLEIAEYAWTKLKRSKGSFSFLDPAIGTGSFFGAFRQAFPLDRIESATGIELDEPFAEAASSIWGARLEGRTSGFYAREPARRLQRHSDKPTLRQTPPFNERGKAQARQVGT